MIYLAALGAATLTMLVALTLDLAWTRIAAKCAASLNRDGSPRTAARPISPQGAGSTSCKRRDVCTRHTAAPARPEYSRGVTGGEFGGHR